jgi:hypothetical protein
VQSSEIGAVAVDATPGGRATVVPWARTRRRAFLAFLLPAATVMFLVTVLPSLFLIVTSFTPFDLTKPQSYTFAGLRTYEQLILDDRFWNSRRSGPRSSSRWCCRRSSWR